MNTTREQLQQEKEELVRKLRDTLPGEEAEIRKRIAAIDERLRTMKDRPPLAAPERDYLRRIFKEASRVDLSGIDRQSAGEELEACLNLWEVYTALLTNVPQANDRKESGLERLLRRERMRSAVDLLNEYPRFALLGEAGSGKSTFVNFLIICLAGERLQSDCADLSRLTAPLPDNDGNPGKEPQPWTHGALLPVKIILRDFAASRLPPSGERASVKHVWEYLAATLDDWMMPEFAPLLKTALTQGDALLLFDGLDEVPEADGRRHQAQQAIEDATKQFDECRILVTSRTYAYTHPLAGFADAALAPFSKGQICWFADRWYEHVARARGMSAEQGRGRAELLKRAIFRSEQLEDFARRPLLLTLMASLHAYRRGSLPEKRGELYRDATELLLDWWERGKIVTNAAGQKTLEQPSLTEMLKIGKDELLKLLNRLAFEAHARQPELTGTADVSENDLWNGLRQIKRESNDVQDRWLKSHLSDRAGLLVPRGEQYTFPHRSFQEYLAACHLLRPTMPPYPHNIVKLARESPDRWREVVLLAAAKSEHFHMISSLAGALCPHDATPEANSADAYCALFAAQAIVETAQIDAMREYEPAAFERLRGWLKALMRSDALPALERANAGNALAALGDDRPGVGLLSCVKREGGCSPLRGAAGCAPLLGGAGGGLPDIDWVKIPAGSFMMGSDEDEREQPRHCVTFREPFWISRFPITNAQFRAFIKDGGYAERAYWTAEGWAWRERRGVTEPNWAGGVFDLDNHPVVRVSWFEATAFCAWLTIRFRSLQNFGSAVIARLPSEAEWEYAARGKPTPSPSEEGSNTSPQPFPQSGEGVSVSPSPESGKGWVYPWGGDITPERANYDKTKIDATSAVGCFPRGASAFGVEEMAGNVWEWCSDAWHDDYTGAPDDGSVWKILGDEKTKVLRGGAWNGYSNNCRSACRGRNDPVHQFNGDGCRVVAVPLRTE